MKKYIVIRMCNRQDGSFVAPAESYEEETPARSTFYTRAGQAVASDNLTDTVILVTAEGFQLDKASFTHAPAAEQA